MLNRYLILLILVNGFLWLRSSLGKFPPEKFINNLGGTLQKFASNNPYSWYKEFLQNVAIPNSQTFGFLTFWGEFLVAISLVLGALYLLLNPKGIKLVRPILISGLLGSMFLNLIFWLAAGWTSPSTDSLNLLMLIAGLIGLVYILKLAKSK